MCRQCIYWIQHLLDLLKNRNQHILRTITLIQLITYFETNDWDVLSRMIVPAIRQLRSLNIKPEEQVIIDFLIKSARTGRTHDFRKTFIQLKTDVEEASKKNNTRSFLTLFPFMDWLESKINNQPFQQYHLQQRNERAAKTLALAQTEMEQPGTSFKTEQEVAVAQAQ